MGDTSSTSRQALEEQSWGQIEVGVPVQVLSSASTKTLHTSSTSRQALEEQSWGQIEVGVPVQVLSSASTKTRQVHHVRLRAQSPRVWTHSKTKGPKHDVKS